MLNERLPGVAPAGRHDVVVDRVPLSAPALDRSRATVQVGEAEATIQGDPAHQPSVRELLLPAASLPDTLLRLVPVVGKPVQEIGEPAPSLVATVKSILVAEVDVELQLVRGAISDTHGA